MFPVGIGSARGLTCRFGTPGRILSPAIGGFLAAWRYSTALARQPQIVRQFRPETIQSVSDPYSSVSQPWSNQSKRLIESPWFSNRGANVHPKRSHCLLVKCICCTSVCYIQLVPCFSIARPSWAALAPPAWGETKRLSCPAGDQRA